MKIIFDSNIFIADFNFKSSYFAILEDCLILDTSITVIILSVVLEEVINKYQERLLESWNQIQKPLYKFRDLAGNDSVSIHTLNLDIKDFVDLYKKNLHNSLQKLRCDYFNYPSVSHETLLRKDLSRKKPFSIEGKGYRDSLIWYSIIEIIQTKSEDNEEIVFVTNNPKDFFEENSHNLHKDLLEDLSKNDINLDRIKCFANLKDLVEKLWNNIPNNKLLSKIEIARIEEDYEFCLEDEIKYGLLDIKQDIIENEVKLQLEKIIPREPQVSDLNLVNLDICDDLQIDKVFLLKDKSLFINFQAEYTLAVEFFIDKSEYYSYYGDESIDVEIDDDDWNEYVMSAHRYVSMIAKFNAKLDIASKEFVLFEVEQLERFVSEV